MDHMPDVSFEWSLGTRDGSPPDQLETLASDAEVRSLPSSEDLEGIELLRAAGLHFDQEALTPQPDYQQLLLVGCAAVEALATAIATSARDRRATLAVDATSDPVRVIEVAGVANPILALSSARHGTRQLPPEAGAVEAALREAIGDPADRRADPPPAPEAGAGESIDALADTDAVGAIRSDEMVSQEAARLESALHSESAQNEAAAGFPARAWRRVRTGGSTTVITPIALAGALLGARRLGANRRWLIVVSATVLGGALADRVFRQRRRAAAQWEAEQQILSQLDGDRVQMERGQPPTESCEAD